MDYRNIIESRYNREAWQQLLHDIFRNKVNFWNAPSQVRASSRLAKQAFNLGKISLADGESIAIYEVELTDNVDIERNRRGIRDMLTTDWRNMGYAGAFMFCYRQNESVLRFSYVSESWSFADDGTYKKDSTDTRRFTYLLGEGHRSRTAIQQFEGLKKSNLSLKDLTKAFSVDAVSDMFFADYKQQYEDIIAFITGKRMVKVDNKWEERFIGEPNKTIFSEFCVFADPEKAIRDYVKKLMGRLVFLQFLQKKGWLGVPINAQWGEGDREFIQHLFENTADKDTFVDNVLEPLFNDINSERDGDIASLSVGKDIRVPYLNGGLFEPDAADAVDFPLPAEYMKSMLDFFASYNFTIDENDPDDAEMGVDPEMLGRIFENLLEDNKDKGAFYTPKEIVSYMCRESLIAYLQTDITDEAQREAIRQFVTTHKQVESLPDNILQNLIDVKICDPAIGSGAFPMGLLKELYLCRAALEGFDQKKAAEIKKHIIQQNIYGVDIEGGAVDTARLRFWLALIVDKESPEALPNLDFKIMQGNSLLESFHGIDLSNLLGTQAINQVRIIFDDESCAQELLLKSLRDFYSCSDAKKKKTLREKIDAQLRDLLRTRITKPDLQDEIDALGSQNDKFFLWHTWFSDVFSRPSKQGFDIVIGNPPYIDSETMMKSMPLERDAYKETFDTAKGNWDIYIVFFELGMKMLKNQGTLSFITPNKWISIGYGKALRDWFFGNLFSLCDCQKIKVFEAGNEPVISTFLKTDVKHIKVSRFEDNYSCHLIQTIDKKKISKDNLGMCISDNFSVLARIIKQARTVGDYIDVENPFSTSEAYQLIDILKDNYSTQDYKLINTGTIDPYINLWGYKTTSYLKGKYKYPTINKASFKEFFPKRIRQVSAPKIIITGMRYFECFLDIEGNYVAGKSTIILLHPKDPKLFKILLGILNSKIISFFIRGAYSTLGIGGGINFSRDMVEKLPLPIISHESEKIVSYVDKILLAKRDNMFADTIGPINIIDIIVYHLYGLTYDDVLIVDPETPITRREYDNFEIL